MNERRETVLDEESMKLGLLMETAQAHQTLAEDQLRQLQACTRDLDKVVCDQIRQTLAAELRGVSEAARGAIQSLRGVQHAAHLRAALWSLGSACVSGVLGVALVAQLLPSQTQIDTLRARRDRLAEEISSLEQQGGRIELRRCGAADRLCVRVDRDEPSPGAAADFLVVKGH